MDRSAKMDKIDEAGPLATLRARAAAAEEERDKLKTDLEDCAELVGQYASAEAPEGMETLAKDRDRWFDLATTAEATLREREAEIERLRAALKPFAACVFNDNGDVTISTGHLTTQDWLVAKRARAALAQPDRLPETATGGETV
jgi:hypothetical protein